MKNLEDILLSKNITIRKYKILLEKQDKDGIADFIYVRFYERYIKPLKFFDCQSQEIKYEYKNGFLIMAICCLMIETLYSFMKGLGDTKGKGRDAFKYILQHEQEFREFSSFSLEFWDNIRCGILHLGETKGGWRISRTGSTIFDSSTLTINANLFLNRVEALLINYCSNLRNSDWQSEIWENLRNKMMIVIENCKR